VEDRSGVHIGVDPVQLTHRQILSSGEHRVNSAKPERFDNDPGALASASAENANCNRRAAMEFSKKQMDIGLVTADAEKARRFYGEVMQLREEEPMQIGDTVTQYRFRAGGQLVKLMDYPDKPQQRPSGLYDGIGYRVLAFFVDDLDDLIGRIEAGGGRVAPGVDLPGKLRIRFAKDADGNMLELLGLEEPAGDSLEDRVQVGMTVANSENSRHFYGQVLGLAEHTSLPMRDDMTRYGFSAGSSTLKFWSRPEPLANFAGALNASVGIRFVTLWVRKIDALAAALEARGAKIVIPPMQLPDARIFFAEDPDGNWIEFAEPAQ
jgi:catechol 2,3-dioxygenase-like lactoylglutathione lyase family enzyme